MSTPMLFVSYSHDTIDHKNWVLKLATDLRSHGVDAILDQWDLRIGTDLRFFMENGLSSSNLVLCVCSEEYVEKVNSGTGGAGYEGMLMTQELLRNVNSEYVIPVVRNNPSNNKVPRAFGSKLYIDFSDDAQYLAKYRELLERIYGEDKKKKPPLGENPFEDSLSKRIDIKTKVESVQYSCPAMSGTVTFRFDNNNGVYTIGTGEYQFETRWSRAGNNSIHAYGLIGYIPGRKICPKVEELIGFDFSSRARTIHTGEIVIIQNMNRRFAAIRLGEVKSSSHGNPYDEMIFEYHIYGP